jgi:hypothetical protein
MVIGYSLIRDLSPSNKYLHLLGTKAQSDFLRVFSCFNDGVACLDDGENILGRTMADSILECLEYCQFFPSGKCTDFNFYHKVGVCLALKGCPEIQNNNGE